MYPLMFQRRDPQPKSHHSTACAFSQQANCALPVESFCLLLRRPYRRLLYHYSAWLTPQDISKLQRHEIQSYIEEPYRRSGDLLKGYQIALDPKKWEEDQAQLKQNEEEEVNDEVDQLESENDEDDSKKSKTKKRKRESESAPSSTKAKKAPKGKKEATESTKKAGSVRAKKNGTKPKATVESEDEGDHAEAEGEEEESPMGKKPSPPPAKKVKRDKEEENDDGAPFLLISSQIVTQVAVLSDFSLPCFAL